MKQRLTAAAARWVLGALALVALVGAVLAQAQEPPALRMRVDDPRAFGHLTGDVLTRRVVLDVPRRLELVEASLPSPGRIGQSFELRAVEHERRWTWSGTRHTLALRYQVFRAPREPVVLDLPAFVLRFEGTPREEQVRVDFAPVGLVPLGPDDALLRTGFGTLRPDIPAPWVDTRPERTRLLLYAVAALLPLGYLLCVRFGVPWRQRRQQPFARLERALRGLPSDAPPDAWRDAWRRVHGALDATAGEVLHAGTLDRWIIRAPRYASVRDHVAWFFDRSQTIFFGGPPTPTPDRADRARLLALCRSMVDIERGRA